MSTDKTGLRFERAQFGVEPFAQCQLTQAGAEALALARRLGCEGALEQDVSPGRASDLPDPRERD
jgi:hypothetical protein